MAAMSNEIEVLAGAKAKLARQFSGNFDPRLGDIYIPPLGAEQEAATEKKSFPLLREVATRLTATPLRSLLLLGNSGIGKTCLSLRFCKMVWEMVAEGDADLPLPLYIYLPQYKEQLQQGLLEQALKDADLFGAELRIIRRQPLLLILDGFDEVSINHNVYQSQGWGKQGFNIKILVSCRPEALLNKNPQALFEAGERFASQGPNYQKLYLQLFNDNQIEQYLQTYLGKEKEDGEAEDAGTKGKESEKEAAGHLSVQDYLTWLERLPSLKALVKTPFLLTVVAQALPSIIQDLSKAGNDAVEQKQFTQNELFRRFLDHWFFRQAQRVKAQGMLKGLPEEDLAGYMRAYAQNLASSRMGGDGQLNESPLTEEQCLRLEFVEPIHDRALLERYNHLNPNLRQSRFFFTEDGAGRKTPIIANIQAVRSGCLLQTVWERFKFLHKSITEYLAAQELMGSLLGNYDRYLETLLSENAEDGQGLNRVLLTKEPEMIKRLAEAVEADERFKKLLDDIVIASKETLGLSVAAANAITVLNYAGVDFSGRDLSEVQISGADLRAGTFSHTNFKGANLAEVNFAGAYLGCADWRGAEVLNIQFGERAYYELPNSPTSVGFHHPNAETLHWLVGCDDGHIYRFDDKTNIQLAVYEHLDRLHDVKERVGRTFSTYSLYGNDSRVNALAIHNDSHLLVSAGENKKLWLWDLRKGKAIKALVGHTESVTSVAISLDGRFLVSGSRDKTIRLWYLPEGREGLVLRGHRDTVTAVAISPDGQLLVSGSEDTTLRLWHLPEGREGLVLRGHTKRINCLVISPDGRLLISGSDDNMLRLWYLPEGKEGRVLCGHTEGIKCLAISPDGRLLISGSVDIRLWYLPEGREGPVLNGHTSVSNVSISPDGRLLVSVGGGYDRTLRVWHLSEGRKDRVLSGHTDHVTAVAISYDGQLLASGSEDGTIRLWQLPEGFEGRVLRRHEKYYQRDYSYFTSISTLAISPDGQLLVSGGKRGLSLRFLPEGKKAPVLEGHISPVNSVAISPDGQWLVSGGEVLRLWYLPEKKAGPILYGHTEDVTSVTISSNGKLLVSGSKDNTLRFWYLPEGKSGPILRGHTDWVQSVVISPDGQLLVSGSRDTTLRLWHLPEGREGLVLRGHTEEVTAVVISPDGQLLVSGGHDATIHLWYLPEGKEGLVLHGHKCSIDCLAISPDGQWLVSGSGDTTLRLWKLPEGKEGPILGSARSDEFDFSWKSLMHSMVRDMSRVFSEDKEESKGEEEIVSCGHGSNVTSIAISPDGRLLVSGDRYNTLRFWSLPQGKENLVLDNNEESWDDRVSSIAISPDGRWLVSGNYDGVLCLWQLPEGKESLTLRGHKYSVYSVTVSPDGKLLVSGGRDEALRLWYLPEGRKGPVLRGHTRSVTSVAVSPDGQLLVSGSYDNTLRLWHLPEGKKGPVLSGHTSVSNVTISPDGQFLVLSRDEANTLQLWYLPACKEGPVLRGHTGSITSVVISLDGRLLVSGSRDNTLRFWALPSGNHFLVFSLGFAVSSLAMYSHQLIVGGPHGFLLSLSVDASDLNSLKPHVDWLRRGNAKLWLQGLQLQEALHLSSSNQALCVQRGSEGKPNSNPSIIYQARCHWFKPILGTAHHEAQPSLVGLTNANERANHTISENRWVLSVARKTSNSRSSGLFSFLSASVSGVSSNHGFLILEGIKEYRRFIIRAELVVDTTTSHVHIILKPLDNLDEFKKSAENYEANQFEITAEEGNKLLRNIRADQQKTIHYSIRGGGSISGSSSSSSNDSPAESIETHSCLSWCRKHVGLIGKEIPSQWYNFFVTLPSDVTRPEAQSNSSSSSSSSSSYRFL